MNDETVNAEATESTTEIVVLPRTTRRQRWIAAGLLGAGTVIGLALAAVANGSTNEETEEDTIDFDADTDVV